MKKGNELEIESLKLLQELKINKLELELQNNELLLAKETAEVAARKYSELYNFAPSGYFTLSKEGLIIELNISGAKMLGRELEGLIGSQIGFFVSDLSKPIFNQFLENVFTSNANESCEVTLDLNNQFPINVNISGIVRNHEEQCLVIMVDITKTKEIGNLYLVRLHLLKFAEDHNLDELLEETINQAERMTNSLIGFFHFVEDDQKILFLQNWSTRTKKDFCKAEGKGLHYNIDKAGVWADCVREGRPIIHNDYSSLLNKKGLPSGHAKILNEMVVPVFRNRKIKAILGVGNKPTDYKEKDIEIISMLADLAWDITERKKILDSLHESEKHYREMANSITDIFFEMDDDLRYTYWNKASENFYGIPSEVAVGKTIIELLPDTPEIRKAQAFYQKVIATRQFGSFENIFHLGQAQIVFEIRAYPKASGIAVFCSNITQRKRSEEIIIRHNDLLAKLSHFSVELAMLPEEGNLEELIVKKLKEISGAEVTIFSDFNPANRTLTVKEIQIERGLLKKIVGLLGKKVNKFQTVISEDMYREMVTVAIWKKRTLYEMTNGSIPQLFGEVIQDLA